MKPEHDPLANSVTRTRPGYHAYFQSNPDCSENPMFIKTKPIQALTTGRLMENSPKSARLSSENRSIYEAVRLCEG
jgi:hypothetical protein